MKLNHIQFNNHILFNDLFLNFTNLNTNKPYSIIAFVGENGCGKTTLLNEINNYKSSATITNKQIKSNDTFNVLYLKHNSLYNNSMNCIYELIVGKNPPNNINKDTHTNSISKIDINKIKDLRDNQITSIVENNLLNKLHCAENVTSTIDGNKHTNIIDNFSSGQQEILLKLKDIALMNSKTDLVLLDEPEESLHPIWQKKIISIISSLILDGKNENPQIFIATHSERILESLIKHDNTLIIRLYKEEGKIKAEPITQMNLSLPNPTFAELDYAIFHILSFEYHNQLYDFIGDMICQNSIHQIDLYLETEISKICKNTTKYIKEKMYNNTHYKMLPTYIRNYYHHQNDYEKPSDKELENSTIVLIRIIKNIK